MANLTVIILTKNESHNIAACIKSASKAAEIIIIDDFSTDNTVEIATKLGAKVFQRALDSDYASQRNFAQKQASKNWVFHLDADERITPKLMESISQHIEIKPPKVGLVKRENFILNKRQRFGVFKPNHILRLFPKNEAHWKNKVHESAQSTLDTVQLKGSIEHFAYKNLEQYFFKLNRYTGIWAQQAYQRGRRTGFLDLTLRPSWSLFKDLILNGGILDGLQGWIFCFYNAGYTLAKYLKLKELENNNISESS